MRPSFAGSFFPTSWTLGGWFFFLLAPGLLLLDAYDWSPAVIPWVDSVFPVADLSAYSYFFLRQGESAMYAWALFVMVFLGCLPVIPTLAYFKLSSLVERVLISGVVLFVSFLLAYQLFGTLESFMKTAQEFWINYIGS